MIKNSNILITGGTGTLGKELTKQLMETQCDKIVVFSRNEKAQTEMRQQYPDIKYVIGDVRDKCALYRATQDIYSVFHLAAIKSVPLCEEQPMEALKTNIIGTYNVIDAAIRNNVYKVVNMSTDKAADPISFYGMTKYISEKVMKDVSSRYLTEFISVRSGNIFGSSGSVIPLFMNQILQHNRIKLTDGKMTRFFISARELSLFLIDVCNFYRDEKIYYPEDMKSFKMMDVALKVVKYFGNNKTIIEQTGIRPGERMHEIIGEKSSASADSLGSDEDLEKLFKEWIT